LFATLVACARTPSSATAPSPSQPATDVLDFVVGDQTTWPRTGTQFQTQLVDRDARSVCWVKYARADMFECWRWDDRFFYHVVDHAIDGSPGESYSFSDGRWMPRTIAGQWSLDVTGNRVRWFDRNCAVTDRGERAGMPGTGAFPYRLRAWIDRAQDAGALGVRDVLVLEYAPHAPGNTPPSTERYYFARGAGWYRWEGTRGAATFDTPGGPAMTSHGGTCTASG
jgi:hypothetical protein